MSRSQGRIVIVEDDPDIVAVVRAYLERAGYRVDSVGDGALGLASALHTPPSLIVLDWMLPGLDGLEFMKRLRPHQRTPVIMTTARGEEADRILGLEFGADDYVTKPFSPRELVARVHAVVRASRVRSFPPLHALLSRRPRGGPRRGDRQRHRADGRQGPRRGARGPDRRRERARLREPFLVHPPPGPRG